MITFIIGFIAFPVTAIAAHYTADWWEWRRIERDKPWRAISGTQERDHD